MPRLTVPPFRPGGRDGPDYPQRQFLFVESLGRERFARFDGTGAGLPSDSHAEHANGRAVNLLCERIGEAVKTLP